MSNRLLLKNGTALIHGEDDKVEAVRTDILITGSKISMVAPNIAPPPGSEVINCTDKIVSPGFIDTHHHVWQTLLKGRHANHTFLDYMPVGNYTSSLHTAEDTFWAQLAGCLEMIDCGTTSVVDFSHINLSAEHSEAYRYTSSGVFANVSSKMIRSLQPPFRPAYVPSSVIVRPLD